MPNIAYFVKITRLLFMDKITFFLTTFLLFIISCKCLFLYSCAILVNNREWLDIFVHAGLSPIIG